MNRNQARGYNAQHSLARHNRPRPSPYGMHHGQPHHRDHHAPQHHQGAARQRQDQPSQPACQICSHRQPYPARKIPIYHTHYSSLNVRQITGVNESGEEYSCPSCKSRHVPYPDNRIKLVLSDFTLHNFFDPPNHTGRQYVGDMIHLDYLTIPEGYVEDLVHAFRLEYELLNHPKPLDVLLVAGYNDLLQNNSRQFIMEGYRHLAQLVLNLGKDKHPGVTNSFAVASLLYPPRLSWFPDNGATPYHLHNNLEKISWLNREIQNLNLSNSVPEYPRFHTYGVRTDTIREYDEYGYLYQTHRKTHRWEHWLGQVKTDKLRLKPERIFKMATAINNYFALNTN